MDIKVGDLVVVRDGSWSVHYKGDGETPKHTFEPDWAIRAKAWGVRPTVFKVLAMGGEYPTDAPPEIRRNDVMLCIADDTKQVVFSSRCYLQPVAPSVSQLIKDLPVGWDPIKPILEELARKREV